MSYVPELAPDATSQWRELEIRLQEMVLDEIDRLAAAPPVKIEHVSDLTHDLKRVRHYLFIHVNVDHDRQIVSLTGVGYHERAIEGM